MSKLQDHLAYLDELEAVNSAQDYHHKATDFSEDYREVHRATQEREQIYGRPTCVPFS